MHVKEKYSWIKHIDFIGRNLIVLVLSFVFSLYLKFGSLHLLTSSTWQSLLAILCLTNIVITLLINPYSAIFRRPYYEDAIRLFMLALYTFIVVVIFFYLFKIGATYSRITLVTTFLIYYFLSLAVLYVRKWLVLSGRVHLFNVRERKVLVVVDRAQANEMIEDIYSSDIKEYDVAAYCFPHNDATDMNIGDIPVISENEIVNFVLNNHIDDVYISVAPDCIDPDGYKAMVENGVNVHLDIDSITGIQTDDQFISKIGVRKTLSVGPYAMTSGQAFYLIIKRILDIVFGVIGCVLLIPITIAVKLAYLLSGDTAPIFYTQRRVGQYGKPFELLKYRTMVPNAGEILEELLKQDEYREQWERNQKFDKDPRITKVGRVLRKTSLDEFPQFVNVLKGEMSLVGPRPLVEGELEDHDGLTLYNKVKPGITGWWGCNGRSNINYRERLELEYYYVKHCSLYLDVLTIFRTIASVLKRDGAQ